MKMHSSPQVPRPPGAALCQAARAGVTKSRCVSIRPGSPLRSSRQHSGEKEDQHSLPVDTNLIACVGVLIVTVDLSGRQIGRQGSEDSVLPGGVGTAREQPGPRFRILVGATGPMMRMTVRVGAHLRHPGEREGIAPEKVMEILQGRL